MSDEAVARSNHSLVVRRLGYLFAIAAALLVPWVFYLGISLPERMLATHYDVAWAGFDVALFVALAGTSAAALRRSPSLGTIAGATAALLLTDAWFDVVTASTTVDRIEALAMAVLVEIPLALACLWLCGHVGRRLRRLVREARRNRVSID